MLAPEGLLRSSITLPFNPLLLPLVQDPGETDAAINELEESFKVLGISAHASTFLPLPDSSLMCGGTPILHSLYQPLQFPSGAPPTVLV